MQHQAHDVPWRSRKIVERAQAGGIRLAWFRQASYLSFRPNGYRMPVVMWVGIGI
jgi:hypothetical protein